MRINRESLLVSAMFIQVLVSVSIWAQCKPGDPVGRFEGFAASAQAGKLDVSLELLCAAGHYAGELNTPIGVYKVTGGSFDSGSLRLQFALNGDNITIEAKLVGDSLQGSFTSGDDKGPVDLHRNGNEEPFPATTSADNLSLTPRQWRDDLAYFAKELPKRHPDAFANTPKDKFEIAVAELDGKIDHLNSDQIYVGLDHLANLMGRDCRSRL
jgi:hypothetical protein